MSPRLPLSKSGCQPVSLLLMTLSFQRHVDQLSSKFGGFQPLHDVELTDTGQLAADSVCSDPSLVGQPQYESNSGTFADWQLSF